jgi:hypothetical protein
MGHAVTNMAHSETVKTKPARMVYFWGVEDFVGFLSEQAL